MKSIGISSQGISPTMLPDQHYVHHCMTEKYIALKEGEFVRFNDDFVGRVQRNPKAVLEYRGHERAMYYDGKVWHFAVKPLWIVENNAFFLLCRVFHGLDTVDDQLYGYLKTYVGMAKISMCHFPQIEDRIRVFDIIRQEFRYRSMSKYAQGLA